MHALTYGFRATPVADSLNRFWSLPLQTSIDRGFRTIDNGASRTSFRKALEYFYLPKAFRKQFASAAFSAPGADPAREAAAIVAAALTFEKAACRNGDGR
ncbi:MAG TPA: hypothetical protein VEN30_01900 [Paraburkholderia sp.]|nr:hypothetical protein [Paraburkholderia sp.]